MTVDQMRDRVNSLWFDGAAVSDIARICGITAGTVAMYLSNGKPISSNPNKTSRTTKADLVDRIAGISGCDRAKIASLEKANHEALELVLASLRNKQPGSLSF